MGSTSMDSKALAVAARGVAVRTLSLRGRPLSSVLRWGGKGVAAILDQALFAASNFALNILLARWLSADGYGAFSVAYTIFLFVGTFHTGLFTEPMLVFGPGKYREQPRLYLRLLLHGHWRFASLAGLALLGAAAATWLSGSAPLGLALAALGLASPFILFQWLMRRACYITMQPRLAATAGVLYMASMCAGAYVLFHFGRLGSASVFGVLGASSLVSALWLVPRLQPRRAGEDDGQTRQAVFKDHWDYGRWAVATGLLGWLPANAYYLILPLWGGLEATAGLKSLMNLILPLTHAFAALGILGTSALVRLRDGDGFRRLLVGGMLAFVALSLAYGLVLGLNHEAIVAWAYDGRYTEYSSLLWIVGFLPVAYGATAILGSAIRAMQRPDRLFWAYALASLLTLTVGFALISTGGVAGAAVGRMIAAMSIPLASLVILHRLGWGREGVAGADQ